MSVLVSDVGISCASLYLVHYGSCLYMCSSRTLECSIARYTSAKPNTSIYYGSGKPPFLHVNSIWDWFHSHQPRFAKLFLHQQHTCLSPWCKKQEALRKLIWLGLWTWTWQWWVCCWLRCQFHYGALSSTFWMHCSVIVTKIEFLTLFLSSANGKAAMSRNIKQLLWLHWEPDIPLSIWSTLRPFSLA